MLSRQVSNLKSSEPKSDVLPIPPQDNGDEPTDLCTVRPPLNYSLTLGVRNLPIVDQVGIEPTTLSLQGRIA